MATMIGNMKPYEIKQLERKCSDFKIDAGTLRITPRGFNESINAEVLADSNDNINNNSASRIPLT